MELKELLQRMMAENVKANIKPGMMRLNGSVVEGPEQWDDELELRNIERLNGSRSDSRYGDPSEELQSQHMVSPKENMWLMMAKKGR